MTCPIINDMKTETLIQTTEEIDGALQIAGLGVRAYAFCYDLTFRVMLVLFLGLLWTQFADVSFSGGVYSILSSLEFLLLFWMLYHPVIEWLWEGQTPGKKIAGIQVVTRSGQVPSVGAIVLRNLLRMIDMLPGTYLFGIVCCLGSKLQLRLGDILTNTVVVYTQNIEKTETARRGANAIPDTVILDLEKKQYLEELINRWNTMPIDRRCKLAQTFLTGLSLPTPLGFIDSQYDKTIHAMLLNLIKIEPKEPFL